MYPTNSRRKQTVLAFIALASVAYLVGLTYFARARAIDDDEGFYSSGARLVREGKIPYRDFFFNQAPLVPYVYSTVWGLRPRSLVAMRTLSALLSAIAVALWGICLLRAKRLSTPVALATFASVLLNPYWIYWNSVVKTFALANLLMTVGVICLYAAAQTDRRRWYILAGVALGGCASARLLYGPLVAMLFLWLLNWDRRSPLRGTSRTFAYFTGSVCGLIPLILTFSLAPAAILFDNVRYYSMQSGYHLEAGRAVTGHGGILVTVMVYVVGIGFRLILEHPYFAAELGLALAGGLSLIKLSKSTGGPYTQRDYDFAKLILVVLLSYVAAALIPYPPFNQYFDAPLTPLLTPFAAEGARLVLSVERKKLVALAAAMLILVSLEIKRDSARLLDDQEWSLANYRGVKRAIKANSRPDDVILSFWSGYVFESGRRYFPGLNDEVIYRIMDRTTEGEKLQYHIPSKTQILSAIAAGTPKMIVTGRKRCMSEFYANLSAQELVTFHASISSKYALVRRVGDVEVFRRK